MALAAAFAPPPGRTAPLEVYGQLPTIENVALSPDGTRLASIKTDGNHRTLSIESRVEHKLLGIPLSAGNAKLRSIEWADNDNLMVVASETSLPLGLLGRAHEWFLLYVWNVEKQTMSMYPDIGKSPERRIMNVLHGKVMVRRIQGKTVLFVPGVFIAATTLPALFRVDLASGHQRMVRQGSLLTQTWLVDEAGEIAAEENYDPDSQRWTVLERKDGQPREIASGKEPIDFPTLLGFGPEPGTLLVEKLEDGKSVWRPLSIKDGTFGSVMAERDTLDTPIEDRLTYRMIGGVHVDDTAHYVFFDPGVREKWNSIVDSYAGEQVELVSSSEDFTRFIVKINGPLHGLTYYLMDTTTHIGELIGEVYKGLGTPLEVKRIAYKAADGLQIPAYLTLPRGKPLMNLPLIMFPHGGPEARDDAEFDWWAQAMAAQGYLVVQPNYRGSTVSADHVYAGFGQWGRKMQADLSDGVRYLVEEGIAAPTRVCIVGASYGGYAALAGVTLDSGVYRCAVSVGGISDLKRMLKDVNRFADQERRYWDRFIGVTGPSDPLLQQLSPIKHVNDITAPVLLIHGADDSVVRPGHSTSVFDAMRQARKDVELVTLKKEDHWLSHSETRLQMLQSAVTFLRAHNPPD